MHPHCRQNKLRAFCREKGIQLCAFSPLGAKGTAWANNSVMECPVLKQIAHEKGKTIAQVNIAKTKENGIYYSLHFFHIHDSLGQWNLF